MPDAAYVQVTERFWRIAATRAEEMAMIFAERLIGSIRRECVDHIIVLGEVHLRQILQSYARYYNPVS